MNTSMQTGIKVAGISILALLYFSLPALAREKPLALQQLETAFEKEVTEKTRELHEPYQTALSKLYSQKLKSGKLEEALAVKRELERIQRIISPPGTKPEPGKVVAGRDGTYLLLAENAVLKGKIKYDQPSGKLIGWEKPGSAKWNLAKLTPGSYHATLNYHAGPFAGGTIELGAGESSGTYTITGSGKWKDQKKLKLNDLTISGDGDSFVLSVLTARTQGIMELESITLTPKDKDPLLNKP
jgi:hypothetical protein